jgi:hypothetical protein
LGIDGDLSSIDAARMSLHEMLIAISVGAVVLSATYTALEHGFRTHAIGAARAESQQSARAALERLVTEIRYAGRGARWTGAAIVVAESSRLVLASDRGEDGKATDAGDRITWQLVGSVLRRNAGTGAGAQPVANGVRAFELRYLDADGMTTSDVRDVRIVDIRLVTEAAGPASDLAQGVATAFTARVRLRNR